MMNAIAKSNLTDINSLYPPCQFLARTGRPCARPPSRPIEQLERRIFLSAYTLTTIPFLGESNSPDSKLTIDRDGNVFGTTPTSGNGSVFEIPHGTQTIQTLVSFDMTNGAWPSGGVTLDANGNLFGTTNEGGKYGFGTVFEIAKGTNTILSLASFDKANGANPNSGITLDSNGNLYGTTTWGGAHGLGTVFKIASGTGTIQTLASFDGSNGERPFTAVVLDSAGNIFGTTLGGGAFFGGTVFEIPKATGTLQTLVHLVHSNGQGSGPTGLTIDGAGNLFSATVFGGAHGSGTVFEIVQGTATVKTLASFDQGASPSSYSCVALDTNGNLFGATQRGGTYDYGTVFKLPKGGATLQTLISFARADGAHLVGPIILDKGGNLWGTAQLGGLGWGTVFKLTPVAAPTVSGFILVNADTNKDIIPITEGMTLDLAMLPRRLNIRAVASSNAKSVQVVFDGQSRLEQQAPWTIFGDWNGDHIFGNLAGGSHTLTGQAFTGKAGTGAAGPVTTLHFNVINKAPAPTSAVTAFVLFNTATGKDIRVLHNYDTLDLSLLPSTLGVRVQTSGTLGSVQYVVDGKMNAPAINALVVGQHHLTAIPYSGANATGTPGASLEIHLFVVRSLAEPVLLPA